MRKKRLLVVETHSDDSAIGAYGLIRRKIASGYDAFFVVVAVSDTEFVHCGVVSAEQRMCEYESYVSHIGGTWLRGELPIDAECRLDTLPKRRLVGSIERVIADVQPDMLVCQAPSFHHDHALTYEATIAALRPTVKTCPDEILLMENPTYVHSLGPSTDFRPSTYCAMSAEEMAAKIDCFQRCFPTQIRDRENCLSPEGIQAWAR